MTLDELLQLIFDFYGEVEVLDRIRKYYADRDNEQDLEEAMLIVVNKAKAKGKSKINRCDRRSTDLSHDRCVLQQPKEYHEDLPNLQLILKQQ